MDVWLNLNEIVLNAVGVAQFAGGCIHPMKNTDKSYKFHRPIDNIDIR